MKRGDRPTPVLSFSAGTIHLLITVNVIAHFLVVAEDSAELRKCIYAVQRLAYNGDVVAFKMAAGKAA